ncbi:hypothetical protein KM043_003413 [Ampulex compressa]|nr:hypothetical protein KM043_003413 [Ampulex compressa]
MQNLAVGVQASVSSLNPGRSRLTQVRVKSLNGRKLKCRRRARIGDGLVRVARLVEEAGGDKRRPGNLVIVGYRHPEVPLIEIMIGGLIGGEREKGKGGIGERADVGEWLGVKQEAVPTKRTY